MKIVVFDDEKFFCEQISSFLSEFFELKYPALNYEIHSFNEDFKLLQFISQNVFSIVFLDIHTPDNDNSGIELAKYIRRNSPDCHIIFVTSKSDKIANALDGLIRPSQFLVKPFSKSMANDLMTDIVEQIVNSNTNIVLKFGRKNFLINQDSVYYFRKNGRKTDVVAVDRIIEVSDILEDIVKMLPTNFIYIDKGIVVNMKRVSEVDFKNKKIVLNNLEEIFYSRNSRALLKNKIDSSNFTIKMTD